MSVLHFKFGTVHQPKGVVSSRLDVFIPHLHINVTVIKAQ